MHRPRFCVRVWMNTCLYYVLMIRNSLCTSSTHALQALIGVYFCQVIDNWLMITIQLFYVPIYFKVFFEEGRTGCFCLQNTFLLEINVVIMGS